MGGGKLDPDTNLSNPGNRNGAATATQPGRGPSGKPDAARRLTERGNQNPAARGAGLTRADLDGAKGAMPEG